MGSRPRINVPHDLIAMCREYAREVVCGYREGRWKQSLAVSSHGAESNEALWTMAKAGECAVAIFFGIDPYHEMAWNPQIDDGKDHVYLGLRWDVKVTRSNNQYLIWPINKSSIFEKKDFDILILVRGDPERHEMILGYTLEITGWITKDRFRELRQTAGLGHKLTPGTWYVHFSSLSTEFWELFQWAIKRSKMNGERHEG